MQLLSFFLEPWLLVPETAHPEAAMLWGSQATQRSKSIEAPVRPADSAEAETQKTHVPLAYLTCFS